LSDINLISRKLSCNGINVKPNAGERFFKIACNFIKSYKFKYINLFISRARDLPFDNSPRKPIMAKILEIKNLVKMFDGVRAVDDVSFSVEQATCLGLLGPNGAGKTTTIEICEGVIPATSGEIHYKGEPRSPAFKNEIGIQFQTTALLAFLTVRETLETFQRLYQNPAAIDTLVELCQLDGFLDQYNDKISGGQRQRFLLALALVNQPQLLFLDEPSTGLDPQARRNLWQLVQQIKAEGKTIILTTHYMEEAQFLCDDIAILDYGKIIARGSPDALIKKYAGDVSVAIPLKNIDLKVVRLPFVHEQNKDKIEIKTNDVNSCLAHLISQGVDLADMAVLSPNLETVFLSLTGRQLRE
jgi:ABC-2 type transport system ATP-binding protein